MHLEDLMPYLQHAKSYTGYTMALCPFHEDRSPSLMIRHKKSPREKGWFRCLSCEAEGTWEYLLSALEGMPIRVSPQARVSWGLPPLPDSQEDWEALAYSAHNTLMKRDHLKWYWELRGVEGRIEPCVLGWYQGWYTIPVFSDEGEFQRLVLRAGKQVEATTGLRYHTSQGEPVMYAPDWRRVKEYNTLFVVFGMIDALALSDMGYAVVTSTAGKGSFQAEWLTGYTPLIYIVPDMGEETTAHKLAKKLGARARVVGLDFPEDCWDPADYLKQDRRMELAIALARYA